uniref:Putative phosphoglucosamine acetyltransferase n=1 Tax=Culex tarsalis TaxID=7177 RepID=A0A1Q3FGR7_CULTA
MRLNEHLKLVGTNVILVPYEAKHVEKYHRWMQNEELQELTASEPLTLEQEYAMQKSWREDDDKCTFLILDKALYEQTGDEIAALIGDTNIFLLSPDDEDDDLKTGEIEIMIAEQPARGKRYGWESTLIMLAFGVKKLDIRRYRAITKDSNARAIQMFTKMGFREVKRVAVFQEVTFEKTVDDAWLKWIEREVSLVIESYHAS